MNGNPPRGDVPESAGAARILGAYTLSKPEFGERGRNKNELYPVELLSDSIFEC